MAITIEEKYESRPTTDGKTVELVYICRGSDNEESILTALDSVAPATFHFMPKGDTTLEPVHIDENNPETSIWIATVPYESQSFSQSDPPVTGESAFSFDTGGGSQHITQSLNTLNKYAAAGTAPDFKGAIGVTENGVQGVDITVPVYNFSETHYISGLIVTTAYKSNLFRLTGRTNTAIFRSLDPGECLFLGASGSQRGIGDWEITFRFAASPNKTNLTVGTITGIDKKGWEYMWVRYEDAEDTASNSIVKLPKAVYIEKVYEDGDFSLLGI